MRYTVAWLSAWIILWFVVFAGANQVNYHLLVFIGQIFDHTLLSEYDHGGGGAILALSISFIIGFRASQSMFPTGLQNQDDVARSRGWSSAEDRRNDPKIRILFWTSVCILVILIFIFVLIDEGISLSLPHFLNVVKITFLTTFLFATFLDVARTCLYGLLIPAANIIFGPEKVDLENQDGSKKEIWIRVSRLNAAKLLFLNIVFLMPIPISLLLANSGIG